jgi:ornithine carbamoyltransferase
MANSLIMAGYLAGMEVVVSGPAAFQPGEKIKALLAKEGLPAPVWEEDPAAAIQGADAVYTDVWVSMGDEAEAAERLAAMQPYRVTKELFALAKADAWFLHCMPTHPGEEVTQEVLDLPRAILYDQGENRLHMQKAIMAVLATEARTSLLHK